MSMIGNFLAVPDEKVAALMARPEGVADFLYEEGPNASAQEALDIDKAWGGIHYMLTGDAWEGPWPLNFILAGEPLGDEDVGYGPARAFRAAQVREIAAALANVTHETLRARFDPKAMDEVYPQIWDEGEEALSYCLTHFDALKAYVGAAAQRGDGLLVWLN